MVGQRSRRQGTLERDVLLSLPLWAFPDSPDDVGGPGLSLAVDGFELAPSLDGRPRRAGRVDRKTSSVGGLDEQGERGQEGERDKHGRDGWRGGEGEASATGRGRWTLLMVDSLGAEGVGFVLFFLCVSSVCVLLRTFEQVLDAHRKR